MEANCEMHRALSIPEIRERILQFCSRKDLPSCRLVCTDWLDSSLKAWNSKARIRLTDGRKMWQFLAYLKSKRGPPKPFAHFCLTFPLTAQITVANFWRVCGENVKILELISCKFRTPNDLRAVLFQLCPNMEKLSIRGVSVLPTQRGTVVEPVVWTVPTGEPRKLKSLTVDHGASKNTGITWMEYFSNFSSLEVLRMQKACFGDRDIFRAMTRIRELDQSKLKLKILRICYRRTYMDPSPADDLLRVLFDPGLELQSLAICVNRVLAQDIQEGTTFRAILNAHRTSLKTLELNCRFQDMSYYMQSPLCVKLDDFPGQFENLHQATFMSSSISSLNFLKFTPNLSKLLVKYHKDVLRPFSRIVGNTDFDGMGDLRLTLLETLELNFDEPSLSSDDFQRLMELMPNVRRLKMHLDNMLFEQVCQRWEKLVCLEVVRGQVDSFGLTGLEGCPLFLRRRKHRPCIPFPTSATVPRANITCLKKLETLSMEGPPAYGHYQGELPISLSHWAAHLGIEQLPHLEHLRLHNYNLKTVCGAWERLLERYPWPKRGTQSDNRPLQYNLRSR